MLVLYLSNNVQNYNIEVIVSQVYQNKISKDETEHLINFHLKN